MAANYPGIYRGICFDAADPDSLLRIRLQVPQILGDVPTGWAWPCLTPGWRGALVKPHANHSFTDNDTGTGSGGSASETLAHTNNHTLQQQTPLVGEGVWVMFEGGNQDYPIWIGTF